jgi:prefoldin beta subunit
MGDDAFRKEVSKLQMLEQSFQNTVNRRVQAQEDKEEIQSALDNLKSSEEAYQIIANILIKKDKDELVENLNQKLQKVDSRIKALKKNESMLKEKISAIREDALSRVKNNESGN